MAQSWQSPRGQCVLLTTPGLPRDTCTAFSESGQRWTLSREPGNNPSIKGSGHERKTTSLSRPLTSSSLGLLWPFWWLGAGRAAAQGQRAAVGGPLVLGVPQPHSPWSPLGQTVPPRQQEGSARATFQGTSQVTLQLQVYLTTAQQSGGSEGAAQTGQPGRERGPPPPSAQGRLQGGAGAPQALPRAAWAPSHSRMGLSPLLRVLQPWHRTQPQSQQQCQPQ